MFKFKAILAVLLAVACSSPATADDNLRSILQKVFITNPEIQAARYEYLSVAQDEDIAFSGYRPNVSLSASLGLADTVLGSANSQSTKPRTYTLSATQPLYRGGQTVAGLSEARNRIEAQAAFLSATQQSILLEAATIYTDVIATRHIFDLNQKNEERLEEQLVAEEEKFRLGQSTKTDVSQAKARLARAKADRINSHADVKAAEADYLRIVGEAFKMSGKAKQHSMPVWSLPVPSSIEEAMLIATDYSPELIATEYIAEASTDTVRSVWGQLLPQVNLIASASREYDTSLTADNIEEEQVVLEVTVPLYQSGSVRARKKQAERTEQQRKVEVHVARRELEDNISELWQRYNASLSEVDAIKTQVEAAKVALEGTREEARVGARTTLDILDSEQELLDAEVGLTQAERDSMVLQWQLLRQIGWFTPDILEFEVITSQAE